ncbi:MAG: tetratricopeptide repeat protein [Actinomycetota bacterium]|nr:tetratricopeptide repeat protein [Actinomycetota bacterium]
MRSDLPSGTVTFLFTDVEGSTKLLHELEAEGYAGALAEHRRVLREAFQAQGGVEVDTQGDAFFVAFPTAPGALAAVREMLAGLEAGLIRVRMGLHTGTPFLAEEGYVGPDVNRAARIAACGHGGQVLVSSSTASLLGTDGLRDLGEHRLKDLSAPERIFQLGDDDFPALKSLYRTNLPVPATPFLGRERELAEIGALLRDAEIRLVTLTGPGGTGKTRLGLQAAAEASERYPDGVFWVPLAPLRDPALVLDTAAQVLEANDGLAAHVADKHLLLLFDNFEHVVEAAENLSELLADCRNLHLLVTSRELLALPGEQAYPIPPLEPQEGSELFVARARAADPAFVATAAVSELCARLDNLPLALELAAARVRVLSPEQLLGRLSRRLDLLKAGRGVDPRQQTLRATIEWSYELLNEEEQGLLARLAVFRGGCTLEAAEDVCEADIDTLQSLVDKSLLRQRDDRFWMLETIHEYAVERLADGEEVEVVHDRHVDHFLALAERADEEQLDASWFPVLDDEHDNIRAALDWASVGRVDAEARLVSAVAEYWLLRGHGQDAHQRLTGALERYETRDRVRARLLTHLADLDGIDKHEALSHLEEALGLWRELGDAPGEAQALETLGWLHDSFGEYESARTAHEQSLTVGRQAGVPEIDQWGAMAGLCHLFVSSGEIESAESMARELRSLGARHGARRAEQLALHFLADCPLVAGNYAEAEDRYLHALAHARASGLPRRSVDELLGVAMSKAGHGDHARAVRLATAAYAEAEALGKSSDHWWSKMQEWFIGGARASLARDELEEAERAGREAPFEAVLDEVLGVHSEPDA